MWLFLLCVWVFLGGAIFFGFLAGWVRYYCPSRRWLWSLSVVVLVCASAGITFFLWDSIGNPSLPRWDSFLIFPIAFCSLMTLLGALTGLSDAKHHVRQTKYDAPPAPPIDPIWDSKYAHLVWEHYYRKAAAIYHAHLRAAMTGALTGGQFAGGQVEVNVFVQNALRAAFEAAIQHLVDCGVQRELAAHNLTLMVPTPNIDPLPAEHSDSAEVRGAAAESPR